jgi:hypothetical protein
MPLGNVLGHLTRTFALAEKLLEKQIDVHISIGESYTEIVQLLPKEITKHSVIEMPLSIVNSLGAIRTYNSNKDYALQTLQVNSIVSSGFSEIGSQVLKKMINEDEKLIEKLQPDIIITDYRFTATYLSHIPREKFFHISNILGFPSIYRQAYGTFFSPLNIGNVLVPGIPNIENDNDNSVQELGNVNWCGHFIWKGWNRLNTTLQAINKVDIFLCFGSTGNGSILIPWLIKNIHQSFSILLATNEELNIHQDNLTSIKLVGLEPCLKQCKVVCCHGGHGTVMECIVHKKPMLIIPHNLEQLEIGRQIQKLGLGILVDQKIEKINNHLLNKYLIQLITDSAIKNNLETYSNLLKKYNGVNHAASVVLRNLSN